MKKLLILGFLVSAPALAEPVPQNLLDADRVLCEQDCKGDNGQGEDKLCLQLCGCASRELGKAMDKSAYLKLRSELATNKLTKPSEVVLGQTREVCLREAGIKLK